MATSIEARYKATTPMFCGGADGMGAELRLPSFKGSLRFWWRALAWARLNGDLANIKTEEDKLFGSAAGGQSRVLMKLGDCDAPRSYPGHSMRVGIGARYLGYGMMERDPRRTRFYLESPFEFTVKMRGRDLKDAELRSLQDALIALGLLGGIGAKSRKGYGSLALQSLTANGTEKWRAPRSPCELRSRIKSLSYEDRLDGMPKYTALSNSSRHLTLEREQTRGRGRGGRGSRRSTLTAVDLLDQIGNALKQSIESVKGRPRVVFGLPRAARGTSVSGVDRRASPLFIHIHECADSPCRGIVSSTRSVPAFRRVVWNP